MAKGPPRRPGRDHTGLSRIVCSRNHPQPVRQLMSPPGTSLTCPPVLRIVRSCVDFRMPVVDDVPLHGVRRPKISNERNRGVSYAKGSARSVRKLSSAPNSKCAHNFGVVARGLLTGDLMFCTVCEFNDLRVAKLTRLATSGRLLRWPVFSGMACINFSRAKMSAANQANLFRSVWSRYFSRRRCRLAQS